MSYVRSDLLDTDNFNLMCFCFVFLEKLLGGVWGEIEIAVCEGGHTCVSVYACKC